MQFTIINSPALRSELAFLKGVTETKQTVPALSNFCFDFIDNKQVKVLATDLDISASTILEVKSCAQNKNGLINAKKLLELLTDLPNNVECEIKQLDNQWVELKSGKSKYKITGQAREDFPSIQKTDLSQPIELIGIKFSSLINNTIIATSIEDSQRYALNGAQLVIENNTVTMIATDGHRLALSSFSNNSNSDPIKAIIPKKALAQVKLMIDSVAGEKVPDFFFSHSPNQICFQFGNKTLYSRTLSGQFPNWNLVLPSSESIKISISLNTQELKSAVKRVSKMADMKTLGIKFSFGENLLSILAQTSESGQGEEHIDIENTQTFDIGLNSHYLMDFLNKVETEKLTINFKDNKSQCLLIPGSSDNIQYKYVIMPLRI